MITLARPLCLLCLLLSGATFGFFYAWVCSTMWGLDAADPRVAIGAMQAMNASVRNAVFAPAFFGTPVAMLITSAVLLAAYQRAAGIWMGIGGAISLLLGVVLTAMVHIPMNEALAMVDVPQDISAAQAIWNGYSPDWQLWNQIRTVTTGLALLCAGIAIMRLRDSSHSAANGTRP